MYPYFIAVYVGLGVVVIVLLAYAAYRVFNKSTTYSKVSTSNGLTPPRIVLTPSSPEKEAKRLYSPPKAMKRSRESEEKLNKQRKRDRRKDVMSMWLPKRKDTLPITKTTIVQPMPMEMGQPNGAQRGRLTFSMHNQYKYESNTSAFVVKLLNASDLPSNDYSSEALDVFVKTQLVPSRKQLFISKVIRQTFHPLFAETYEFDISYQELQTQKLLFQIMEFDCLSRHDMIGEVRVNLADLGTHGFNILREVTLCINIAKPNGDEDGET